MNCRMTNNYRMTNIRTSSLERCTGTQTCSVPGVIDMNQDEQLGFFLLVTHDTTRFGDQTWILQDSCIYL